MSIAAALSRLATAEEEENKLEGGNGGNGGSGGNGGGNEGGEHH